MISVAEGRGFSHYARLLIPSERSSIVINQSIPLKSTGLPSEPVTYILISQMLLDEIRQ